MSEDEITEFLFKMLLEKTVEVTTGINLQPVTLFIDFVHWLTPSNPVHQRAATRAIEMYKKSGFQSDFRSDFRTDFRS